MVESILRKSIKDALTSLNIPEKDIVLEHPTELSHGDFSSNVALVVSKEVGKKPQELAQNIAEHISSHLPKELERVEIAGPGFINFYLSREFFRESLAGALEAKEQWGRNTILSGQRVMVEYTDPNPFKPFHIGHLMSNTIGEALTRVLEFSGAEVRRANYQGDIGLHVAKTLWGIGKEGFDARKIEELGMAYAYGHDKHEEDEDARAEINELNKKIAEGDSGLKDTYDIGLKTSLDHFEDIYKTLGTQFDFYFFESQALSKGVALLEEGIEKNIFEESDGAIVFKGEEYGLHTRVFRTSYGATTYETRDLGLPLLKEEKFRFDTSITITAVEQNTYFDVVFKVFSLLRPELGAKLAHVPHGMMQLTSGKMSSREGNVVTGESLLMETEKLAHEKMKESGFDGKEDTSKDIAVAAIKYSILKQASGKNIVFDKEKALSFEGDSGPYLQYTCARISSMLQKAEKEGYTPSPDIPTETVTEVERLLYRFPEVVERAVIDYEPHYITTYLIELSSSFNSWYGREKILDESKSVPYKLALAQAVSTTLRNGLHLLGIRAPERM